MHMSPPCNMHRWAQKQIIPLSERRKIVADNQILDSGYPKDNDISDSIRPTEKYDLSNYIRISWEHHFWLISGGGGRGNRMVSGHTKRNTNTCISFFILAPQDKSNSLGISSNFLMLSYVSPWVSRNSCTGWVPGGDVTTKGLSFQTIAGCRMGPMFSRARVQGGSL